MKMIASPPVPDRELRMMCNLIWVQHSSSRVDEYPLWTLLTTYPVQSSPASIFTEGARENEDVDGSQDTHTRLSYIAYSLSFCAGKLDRA